jgi:hypothetical protein
MKTTLFVLGCSVFIILGIGHAVLTLFTAQFQPKDAALFAQLKASRTGLSNTGNIWKGMTGFHLSHSLGMMIFGSLYIALMLDNSVYLTSSNVLIFGSLFIPIVYAVLAQAYWFNLPRNCFIAATCLIAASVFVK